MGMAPITHLLFCTSPLFVVPRRKANELTREPTARFFNCNPENPSYVNRDRFVLSNGHACALQYTLLHLLGYKVSLDDLKQVRSDRRSCPDRLTDRT